tara:strand:+ start:319 stop:906 length:588 start_codon:yes stop_codon:yes gene_type:complete
MKEYKKLPQFMGGWYINKKLTDELIEQFHEKTNFHQPGHFGNNILDNTKKKSTEIALSPYILKSPFRDYVESVIACVQMYYKKYKFADVGVSVNGIFTNYKIQWYKPSEGYYIWHPEKTDYTLTGDRHLVFMTYLNDVKNGGTEFYYQKKKVPAQKGLTIIWPADWTFTHRGVISNKEDKYIATGWINFLKNERV